MTPDEWQRVREIFEALVDLEPDEARRRLAAEAGENPAVRDEVASLLDHHSHAGSFLDASPTADRHETSRALAPGTRLGPYTIVREVGRGGMGRVHLATDTRLERQVCLKAIREDLASDPVFRERLQREARLAASLSHPGICAVYALEEFDGHLYLATEFVDGRTLRDEIQSGRRPSADEVLEVMRALGDALGAAHAKGIAHRDFKPENVMRSSEGRLKILDFGLARADAGSAPREMATLPGVLVGTLAYMAPEQINGGPTDRRADLFALGVLTYEFATGAHPFAAPTPLATVAGILEREPEPLESRRPDLPSALVHAVDRCLRKSPPERFATAGEVAAALEKGEGGRPRRGKRRTWWRLHQTVALGLYFMACAVAWQLKEWEPSIAARWAFLLTGVVAATAGVIRGHLLFTERAHPHRLASERQKTRLLSLALDLAMGLIVFALASLVSSSRPVAAVLAMGLAAGIGTAAVFIEPATAAAAFDDA